MRLARPGWRWICVPAAALALATAGPVRAQTGTLPGDVQAEPAPAAQPETAPAAPPQTAPAVPPKPTIQPQPVPAVAPQAPPAVQPKASPAVPPQAPPAAQPQTARPPQPAIERPAIQPTAAPPVKPTVEPRPMPEPSSAIEVRTAPAIVPRATAPEPAPKPVAPAAKPAPPSEPPRQAQPQVRTQPQAKPITMRPMLRQAAPGASGAPQPTAPAPAAEATAPADTRAEAAEPAEAEIPTAPATPAAEPAAPGLGKATEEALATVLDAARRDSLSWARRTDAWIDAVLAGAVLAWGELRRDPIDSVDGWLAQAGLPDTRALLVPGLCLAAVLAVGLGFLMRKGDLKIAIDYPGELRGTFHVRIARRKGAKKRARVSSPSAAERARRGAGSSSRTERHLVSRETDFIGVRAGRWFVTVDGFLQPPDDPTVVGTHLEEQEVRVRGGHTVRLDFDFRPKQCPVDVKVLWDKRPVPEALVAWRGHPHSLRYARGGPVRLGAPRGAQTLMVGSGDRVAELELRIESFQPIALEIDLADREHLLFSGCPPAVESYLHGDAPAAARALEREGQEGVANLIRARLAEEQGYHESAARHYAEAGHPARAAAIHERLAQYDKSAELWASAGELVRAAQMYRSAGDLVKAGESYERARDFDSAARCYEEAGVVSKWCEALDKSGRPFEAARIALEHGDDARAIRSLQALSPGDADYVDAANLLVEVLQREGHLDLAVEKIEEIIRTRGEEQISLETCDHLAQLLEENDQITRAFEVLEIVRRRDATWPNLASRMEALRKRREEQAHTRPGSTPELGGFRYEILEELGRGGMGIVFKARDRRLGRVVALKKLPENLRNHPKAVELFLREARACAQLNHPNIVTVHDAGQEGDAFYITMELLEGLPLYQILKRNGALGPKDVAKIGMQVCSGLAYAHEKKIVHRDIKTANLFFTRSKTIKIMDFGLAKMVEEVRRAQTVIGGTPYYMAPEQSLGGDVDHRADLYALGVTFYELLTGKVPFAEGDVAYHHRHTPPPDVRDHTAGVPDALAELILALMAKDPAGRPPDANVVRERLQAAKGARDPGDTR